jgi:hypothetical protein
VPTLVQVSLNSYVETISMIIRCALNGLRCLKNNFAGFDLRGVSHCP